MLLIHISNISIVQGTTFVLQKQTEPRQKLLTAISSGKGIEKVRALIFVSINFSGNFLLMLFFTSLIPTGNR